MGIQNAKVAEQIRLLDQVNQAAAQSKQAAAARQRRQLQAADRRLVAWAEWTIRAQRGETAFIKSLAGDLTGAGAGGGTNPNASGMPDSIYDTDRAVQQLQADQLEVVELEYFHVDLLQRQRADRLGVSLATYERRLKAARTIIYRVLYAPAGEACKRVLNNLCAKSC